ncbi:hypothetical protein TWF281_005493 [Arthrobotrys megalospora]
MPSIRNLVGAAFCASIIQGVTATPNPLACHADNCLRALRGLASKSYAQVSTDCSNYVWTTVTQSVVTVYETSTETATLSTEIEYTAAETVVETSYEVVTETASDTTVIVTQTYPDPHLGVTARAIAVRCDSTGSAPDFPSYASQCTSGARYASACSCFGVPASVATAGSTTTVIEYVTETEYITSSVAVATDAVTQTSVEVSTTTVNVEYTAFAIAITEADDGFPYDRFPPGHTSLYIDLTYGPWEVWGAGGGSSIRQPDGKVYYPDARQRWYHYCTDSYVDTDTGEVYQAPTGAMFVTSFGSTSLSIAGQEVYCNWGSDNVLHCSCTVNGEAYTRMTYRDDSTILNEVLLRNGAIPAGPPAEWEIVAKAIITNHCANNGFNCAGWHDPSYAPIWTEWKKRRSLGRRRILGTSR